MTEAAPALARLASSGATTPRSRPHSAPATPPALRSRYAPSAVQRRNLARLASSARATARCPGARKAAAATEDRELATLEKMERLDQCRCMFRLPYVAGFHGLTLRKVVAISEPSRLHSYRKVFVSLLIVNQVLPHNSNQLH